MSVLSRVFIARQNVAGHMAKRIEKAEKAIEEIHPNFRFGGRIPAADPSIKQANKVLGSSKMSAGFTDARINDQGGLPRDQIREARIALHEAQSEIRLTPEAKASISEYHADGFAFREKLETLYDKLGATKEALLANSKEINRDGPVHLTKTTARLAVAGSGGAAAAALGAGQLTGNDYLGGAAGWAGDKVGV